MTCAGVPAGRAALGGAIHMVVKSFDARSRLAEAGAFIDSLEPLHSRFQDVAFAPGMRPSSGAIAGVAALAVLASGCGAGTKSPGVASLGQGSSAKKSAKNHPIVPAGASFARFAQCMRKHGIQASVGPDGHGISIGGPNVKMGAESTLLRSAQSACRKYMPGGGPPHLSPAQLAKQGQGMRAMTACLRRHGFLNFPDPKLMNGLWALTITPSGGAQPGSKKFETAMQACRPGRRGGPIAVAVQAPGRK
jgi:hypothetical protein